MGAAQTKLSTKLSRFPHRMPGLQVAGPQTAWPGFTEILLPAVWSNFCAFRGRRKSTSQGPFVVNRKNWIRLANILRDYPL